MQVTRRQVSEALYTLLAGAYAWKKSEPTARLWGKVVPEEQPYMGLYRPAEDDDQPIGGWGLQKYILYYSVLVYARRPSTPPPTGDSFGYLLDDLQDAIDKAMLPQLGRPQTLGGLVTQAMVKGRVDRDEGLIDQQGKIEIPIQVLIGG